MQPTLGDAELAVLRQVFQSGWLSPGRWVDNLKSRFSGAIGVDAEDLLTVTCCTEGLFQICEALQLAPEDEVIMPTISFVGAAHAVRSAGAQIRLVDVDSHTLNPTVENIRRAITSRTKAIIVLHYGGRGGEVAQIAECAAENGIFLIEDAAIGLGGKVADRSLGTFGDAAAWSFDPMKLLSAGDGGVIYIKDPEIRTRVFNGIQLGGISSASAKVRQMSERWWELEPSDIGRRSMMNDVTAALADTQLARIDEFIKRRHQIHARYVDAFSGLGGNLRLPPLQRGDVPYFLWIQMPDGQRDRIAREMKASGVYTSFHYWPLHRMKLYRTEGEFPGAESAADHTLLLPLHQGLDDSQVNHVITEFKAAWTRAAVS